MNMTPQEFETALKKGVLPSICFLYGEESFLLERALQVLLERAVDPGLKDFNFNQFFGNESKGIDIIDAAQTLPMFSDRRAVLVKRAEQLKADALEIMLPYVMNPLASTCLVLTGVKIDQRKKFFIEFKKYGTLVEFKRIYDNKLPGFIQAETTLQGKSIDGAGAELLAALIGNNLQELNSQIQKLVAYVGSKSRIAVDDVRTIASNSKAFTAFEFAKYLGMRELPGSLKSLDTLFLHGEEAPMMIGALSSHFRKLWRVRELLDKKMPPADISRELGINSFFLGEIVAQARNFSRREMKRIFDELYGSDLASKSGGQPYTLLHRLAMGICTGNW